MSDRLHSSPVDGAPAFFPSEPVWIAGVVQTASRLLWVRDQLAKMDMVEEAYVPALTQTRKLYGKEEEIETPIPGWGRYFFLRLILDPQGEWAKARYHPGVHALLPMHSLKPLRIADRFISEIKTRIASGEFAPAEIARLMRKFLKGEEVQITDERVLAFHGTAVGTVEWQQGQKVRVQLSCDGSGKAVTLKSDQLAPSGSSRRQARSHLRRNGTITRAPIIARAAG